MPDGRFLSRSIAVSRQLKNVSLEADFLFTRTIPHLDRDGRIDGDPDVIRATVCPLRPEMTVEVIARCLAELARVHLVLLYVVDGQPVVCFPGFPAHQRGMKYNREQPSRLPPAPNSGPSPDLVRTYSDDDVQLVRDVADLVRPSEVKLSEVKGSEVKASSSSSSSSPQLAEMFEQLPPDYHADLTRLIGAVPSPDAWLAEIRVSLDGMHGKALTPDQLGRAIRDFSANGEAPNMRHFRGYLRDAAKPPPPDGARASPHRTGRLSAADQMSANIAAFIKSTPQ